jgi:hypothetical protein
MSTPDRRERALQIQYFAAHRPTVLAGCRDGTTELAPSFLWPVAGRSGIESCLRPGARDPGLRCGAPAREVNCNSYKLIVVCWRNFGRTKPK